MEQLPDDRYTVCAVAVGKESVVADSDKAGRKDVEEKPADEVKGRECHSAATAAVSVVLPREGNRVVPEP